MFFAIDFTLAELGEEFEGETQIDKETKESLDRLIYAELKKTAYALKATKAYTVLSQDVVELIVA